MSTKQEKKETVVCDVTKEKEDLESPEDKFNTVYIVFFLLGLVHFLPWSFFTTATQFWMYKFRNTTINETSSEFRTDLQAEFNAALKITLQVTDIAVLILTVLFGHYIRAKVRMIGALTVVMVLFALVTASVEIDTDSWQGRFFAMIMAISTGINGMNAVFTITIYTIIAHFPHIYLSAYIMGGGLSGIFTSTLQILSLTLGLSTVDSALVYFSLGLFVIVFTLLAFIATGRNRFYLHYMKTIKDDHETLITFKEGYHLLKKIWSSVLMMGLFFLTMDAAPTALVVSENEGDGPWNDVYFIPTITYLLTSVTGLIGRGLSFYYSPNLSGTTWCSLALIRFLVYAPLFMLCNAQPRHHLPVLLPHDYQYIILIATFHLSGGYMLSRCSYNIRNLVEPHELKKAYHVNMLFAGIWLGALSFVGIVSVKLL